MAIYGKSSDTSNKNESLISVLKKMDRNMKKN